MTTLEKLEIGSLAYMYTGVNDEANPLSILTTLTMPPKEEQADVDIPFTPGPRFYHWHQTGQKPYPCGVVAIQKVTPHPSPVLADMGIIIAEVNFGIYTLPTEVNPYLQGSVLISAVYDLVSNLPAFTNFLNPPSTGEDTRSITLNEDNAPSSFAGLRCLNIRIKGTARLTSWIRYI